MARTKIPVPPEKQCGYTSVIVSYSTGIDSTGAIYWGNTELCTGKNIPAVLRHWRRIQRE